MNRNPELEAIRLQCLDLAVRADRGDAVAMAQRMFAFVTCDPAAPQPTVGEVVQSYRAQVRDFQAQNSAPLQSAETEPQAPPSATGREETLG